MRALLSLMAVSLLRNVEAVSMKAESTSAEKKGKHLAQVNQLFVTGNFIDESWICANEGKDCICKAGSTIWYGHGGDWTSKEAKTGTTKCANSVFGDPKKGTRKVCYC